jgi:hypothetical protein
MRHTISTTVVNTPTGTPGSYDGVMMLVCHGVATTGGTYPLVVDTAYLGTKLADFTDGLNITADYDYVNGCAVFQQINEFYDGGNNDGAYLWLVVTASTNVFTTYAAGTTFKNLVRGTDQDDPNMRVRMIGFCYKPPTAQQSSTDFVADSLTAPAIIQATQESLFDEGYQFSAILDGSNMSSAKTASTLASMATKQSPSVSFCITGSKPNGVSSVGAALGRFSRITIGHGFGAVEDGSSPITQAYLTNGAMPASPITGITIAVGAALTDLHYYMVVKGPITYPATTGTVYGIGEIFQASGTGSFSGTTTTVVDTVSTNTATIVASTSYYVVAGPVTCDGVEYATGSVFTSGGSTTTCYGGIVIPQLATNVNTLYNADINSLGDKQYMFLRKWVRQSGLYWNDAATCDLSTKALSTQEFNRVANRLSSDVLESLTLLMGKAIPIEVGTDNASASFIATKQAEFQSQYLNPLIVSGDISGGSLALTGTRNGVTSINWTYILTINGNPITGSVTGEVKFV